MVQAEPLKWREFARFAHPTVACPIASSMGVFGRKWGMAVLRDIAFLENVRFSDILRLNQGLTPRVLVFRLKELEKDGLIQRRAATSGRTSYYELTPKGRDAIPILTSLVFFGTKHLAHKVFADGKPRSMQEMLPNSQEELLGELAAWAKTSAGARRLRGWS